MDRRTTITDYPIPGRHFCTKLGDDIADNFYGSAIVDCVENSDGTFWVENGEYASRVNYCPYCGMKAPNQIEERQ